MVRFDPFLLSKSRNDEAITKSIIALGSSLKLAVIAEGVEQMTQVNFLRKEGCNLLQGYLICQPVTGEEVVKLLKKPEILFQQI